MKNFILKRQPKAYQGSKTFKSVCAKEMYIKDIETSSIKYNSPLVKFQDEELYGIVYYFFQQNKGTDADNISKPIWDCLKGIMFTDDKQVKLRTAGVFDLSKSDFNIIDMSGIQGEIVVDLIDAFDTEQHVVYVECGILNYSMYKFNIEQNGN